MDHDLTMDRRRFLLGSASVLLLAACSDADSDGGSGPTTTATGGGPDEPAPRERPTARLPHGAFGFPSPFSSNGGFGYIQMSLLYDTLLWKDGEGTLLPWLAAEFERSDDDLTYTFELRPDVSWSDGMPLTAADVAFTFSYYATQEALPPPVIIQPPQGIASVEATSPTTVVITLEAPDVTFAEQVAGALPIIPEHVWAGITDPAAEQDLAILVGSGPYRLETYTGDGGPLLYTAVEDYFLGAPFVERIEFTEVADEFTALLAGDLDSGGGSGVRDDVLAQFEDNAEFGILTESGTTTSALYWNLTRGGALADVAFRQACAKAIDRQDLVARLAGGNGAPGNPGFLGPDNPFTVEVEQHDLDLDGANTLLDDAGYLREGEAVRTGPDGAPLSFGLLIANTEEALAELLTTALAEIGVELVPNFVEVGPALFGGKLSGGYDMAVLGYPGPTAGGPNSDPDLLRRVFSSESPPSLTSATGYADPEFDELAAQQRTTFDEGERADLVSQMQEILARDLPVLTLYYPDTVLVFRTSVLEDWYLTPGQFPTSNDNKQLFVTGVAAGTTVRPTD